MGATVLEQNGIAHETENPNLELVKSEQTDLEALLTVLPDEIVDKLKHRNDIENLLEIVLDLGRLPLARLQIRISPTLYQKLGPLAATIEQV